MIENFNPLEGKMLQILNESGEVRPDLEPRLAADAMKKMYEDMVLARAADAKALKLQRQGRMGTYPSSRGHEACQVGISAAAQKGDWFFPYFRDLGMYLHQGYPLWLYYHSWMGNEAGLRTPDGLNIFPLAIPVASQIPHAVGAAMAARILKKPIAVFCTFGDGATSEGDFHEGLNFAGVFKSPNVFVCYNNQFAISVPRSRQTASATIAQKAVAYGFPGILVDGNDILAVYAAAAEAGVRARSGEGPTLIEAYTYRMGDHTTSDDASRYRENEQVLEWQKRDPLDRFRLYLMKKGIWTEAEEKGLSEKNAALIERAVEQAEATPSSSLDDLFAYTYASLPPGLRGQLAELKALNAET